MTKLEEEITKHLDANTSGAWFPSEKRMIVDVATDVAKQFIEKAIDDIFALEGLSSQSFKEQWLKENGIE